MLFEDTNDYWSQYFNSRQVGLRAVVVVVDTGYGCLSMSACRGPRRSTLLISLWIRVLFDARLSAKIRGYSDIGSIRYDKECSRCVESGQYNAHGRTLKKKDLTVLG